MKKSAKKFMALLLVLAMAISVIEVQEAKAAWYPDGHWCAKVPGLFFNLWISDQDGMQQVHIAISDNTKDEYAAYIKEVKGKKYTYKSYNTFFPKKAKNVKITLTLTKNKKKVKVKFSGKGSKSYNDMYKGTWYEY